MIAADEYAGSQSRLEAMVNLQNRRGQARALIHIAALLTTTTRIML